MNSKRRKKNIFGQLKTEAGFTLIEALVASVLFALVALAFAYTYISSRTFTANSGGRRQAVVLAQQQMETLNPQLFAAVEVLVGAPLDEDPIAGFNDYRRQTEASYVLDDDFSTPDAGPTNSLLVTVQVSPATGSAVNFGAIEIYSVKAK